MTDDRMVTFVEDDETLYRRVVYKPDNWHIDDTGELRVTQTAFNDPNNKPSADRAKLCNHNPRSTQQEDDRNGVVFLLAYEVRAIADIVTNTQPPLVHRIDVIHAPVEDNYAHAQIEADPAIASKGTFRRFRASLAFLANSRGWLIKPFGYRD
jgi:hypothetical protein